jgi:hypothetical protein
MIENLIGKRIKLTFTSDPYTKLKAGALGTVVDVNTINLRPKPSTQIHIKWDSGSTLSLILGEDKFEVMEE